ncbi:MAG: outer membrane protein transport protein, partial [Rikenellaceae bacterium]
ANVAFGVNVGLMYDLCDKWSIGASYRSKMMTVVDEGTTNIDFYNEKVEGLLTTDPTSSVSVMQNGTFAAELPLPSTLSVGVTYLPTDRWKIAAEMQMVGWSTYESLDFNFTSEDGEYVNSSPKGYENTFIYRLGAEYKATEWLTARAGIYFDESPVVSAYFAPETPSMNKIGYTCGLSVMPLSNRNFSIDLAYGYISPAKYDRSASYTSVDGLQYTVYSAYASAAALYEAAGDSATAAVYKEMADGVDYINTFGGNYRAVAHTFSVGLSWGF